MTKSLPVVLYIVVMIVIIVGVDLLFFRHRFEARLIANIAIVAIFAAIYFVFFMRR